ncbi:MAG: class II glutamine amidotransferase [Nannocystaceae bacterium]
MCRFVIYHGPKLAVADLVTRPAHSIIRQSYKSRERKEPLNGDGFGVAWYAPDVDNRPAVFRDITPAWNNKNLRHVARVTQSETILAHVRAATHGHVIQTNCHPFSSGRHAWMHNGSVASFREHRRAILRGLSDSAFAAIRGTTDSEHLMALFLDQLDTDAPDQAAAMGQAMLAVLQAVTDLDRRDDQASTLNLVVTNGVESVASRYTTGVPETANTLYLQRSSRYHCEGDVCTFVDPGTERASVMLASEPLSQHDQWEPIPPNTLVTIAADHRVTLAPIHIH